MSIQGSELHRRCSDKQQINLLITWDFGWLDFNFPSSKILSRIYNMVKWFPIAFGEEKMGLSLTYLFLTLSGPLGRPH